MCLLCRLLLVMAACATLSLPSFGALQVKYVEGTNPDWSDELDAAHIREEMEGWAAEICRSYMGSTAAVDGEILYLELYDSEDGVAATGGNMIWLNMRWLWHAGAYDTRGALIHEMGHAVQGCLSRYLGREIQLDQTITLTSGETEHLTEGLAEWVRRYCFATPTEVQNRERELATRGFALDNYGDGAGLIEYIRRAYGPGILKDLLYYCSTNRGYKVDTMWPALTGRTLEQLLDDWRAEEMSGPQFPDGYDPSAAATARWVGPGNGALSVAANWECVNANGDPMIAVPSSGTAVVAWGKAVPNIPAGSPLSCSSFLVKRWITLDGDTDWRGVPVPVTVDDGATIRTGGHTLTAGIITGTTARVYGHLAYGALKLTGDLVLCGGSVLEMPSLGNNALTQIGGKLVLQDNLPTFIKLGPGDIVAGTHTILTAVGGLPDDLSMLRLTGFSGRKACAFTKSGNTLKATVSNADYCLWTGAAGDGKFSTDGNWADGVKPTAGGGEPIVFAAAAAGTADNDIGDLTPAFIEFAQGCAATAVAGFKFTIPSGAAIARFCPDTPVFTAPVEFAGEIRTEGGVRFSGGVTAPDIHAGQTDLLGHYTIMSSGEWTPQGLYNIRSGSSITVDSCCSTLKNDALQGISVCEGGAFTSRTFHVSGTSSAVLVNNGEFAVMGDFGGDMNSNLSCIESCNGVFRLNGIKTNSTRTYHNLNLTARTVKWNDANAATSKVSVVVGGGGMNSKGEAISVANGRALAIGCTSGWVLGKGKNGSDDSTVFSSYSENPDNPATLFIDTADFNDPSVKRTVTIAGKIASSTLGVAAYGGGTIRFANTSTTQFGRGLAVLGATTLEYASTSAKAGGGDVLLEPGTTLALPSAGSGAVTVMGKLSLTNGTGTVSVRLGGGGTVVAPGTYSLVTAGSDLQPSLVSQLALANPTRVGAATTFSVSSKTLKLVVADTSATWNGGDVVVVPEGGIAVTTITVAGASRENPVAVTMGDGGTLAAGSYQVLTTTELPEEDPREYLVLVNEVPAWHAAAFRREGASIWVDVAPDDGRLGWLNETDETTLLTGTWAEGVEYGADGRAFLVDENVFTPFAASTGNVVTVELRTQLWAEDSDGLDDADAQAAIRLGTNGCFQVWTRKEPGAVGGGVGGLIWVDVVADGVTPVDGREWMFRFTIDYRSGKYKVAVADESGVMRCCTAYDDTKAFLLGAKSTAISEAAFRGETFFTSLLGTCQERPRGFSLTIL